MHKHDTNAIRPADIAFALGLLTRLPVPVDGDAATARGSAAAWAWPVAGAVVGALSALAAWIALWLGLPPTLAAGFALGTAIVATGAMHEDGLADSADGLWGGHDVARRLAIMKDSRIGTYGVLALGLSLLLRWAALTALIGSGWIFAPLVAVGAASRAPMALTMTFLPNARGSGLADSVGQPSPETALAGLGAAALVSLLCLGWGLIPLAFWVALAATAGAALARARIGGQTGDILGAVQQLGEIAGLAALAGLAA